MPRRRARVERVDEERYRLIFDRPLAAEVALMYFGFYPDTQLHWHKGRVTAVVAATATYHRVVADFADRGDDWELGQDSPGRDWLNE